MRGCKQDCPMMSLRQPKVVLGAFGISCLRPGLYQGPGVPLINLGPLQKRDSKPILTFYNYYFLQLSASTGSNLKLKNLKKYIHVLSLKIIVLFIIVQTSSFLSSNFPRRVFVIHIFISQIVIRSLTFPSQISQIPTKLVFAISLLTYYLMNFFL